MSTASGVGTAYLSGFRVTRSSVVCVCFVDRCLSLCPCSFGQCVFCLFRYTDSDYQFGIFKLFLHTYAFLLIVYYSLSSCNVDLIKARFTEQFPSFATNMQKSYILSHCINVVILLTNHINISTFIFKIK
jgi:hypothetical protein